MSSDSPISKPEPFRTKIGQKNGRNLCRFFFHVFVFVFFSCDFGGQPQFLAHSPFLGLSVGLTRPFDPALKPHCQGRESVVGIEGVAALNVNTFERGGASSVITPEPHIAFCNIFVHPLFPVFEPKLKNRSFLSVVAF